MCTYKKTQQQLDELLKSTHSIFLQKLIQKTPKYMFTLKKKSVSGCKLCARSSTALNFTFEIKTFFFFLQQFSAVF